ncbi:MAG TPA: hypothetical protein VNU92_14200 [Edaphobacter sp.]|jgi:hypothetical protein|nr:hypothetical protein [Edaphobacter sp.]
MPGLSVGSMVICAVALAGAVFLLWVLYHFERESRRSESLKDNRIYLYETAFGSFDTDAEFAHAMGVSWEGQFLSRS